VIAIVMHFANPEAFFLLILLPLAVGWSLRARRQGAARFSALAGSNALPAGLARWGPALLIVLRTLSLGLLIGALARPQTAHATETSHTDGITIQLVIDTSYSMKTRDYDQGRQSISRLEAVKHAMRLFIQGGEHGLDGRPNDKIGLITFARDPEVVCPATLDHEAALEALEQIPLSPPVGTNIGDALAWALDRLQGDPNKQKVIILLSDGAHNAREALPPLDAADLARDLKVKIYTIGAVGNRFQPSAVRKQLNSDDEVDEPVMQQIAEKTGGKYFRATDTNGLVQIYQEIDRLEKTRMEKVVHVSFREWFLGLVVTAAAALGLEQLLAATRLLRIP
jgi:Ca-activated chloride channel family protein